MSSKPNFSATNFGLGRREGHGTGTSGSAHRNHGRSGSNRVNSPSTLDYPASQPHARLGYRNYRTASIAGSAGITPSISRGGNFAISSLPPNPTKLSPHSRSIACPGPMSQEETAAARRPFCGSLTDGKMTSHARARLTRIRSTSCRLGNRLFVLLAADIDKR